MKTVYDLLVAAPDTQETRCRIAYLAVADNRYADAAFTLRAAVGEEAGEWAKDAAELAEWLERSAA